MTSNYPDNHQLIFAYIVDYKTKNDGLSPTLEEIRKATGIPSKSTVFYALERMEKEGRIRRVGKARNIVLPGGKYTYEGVN